MIQDFRKLLRFMKIHFESSNIQELKAFFMQEPSIAEQTSDVLEKIDQYLENQLVHLLKVEEVPLGTDFLIIIGFKK